jgi:hypothetical protein
MRDPDGNFRCMENGGVKTIDLSSFYKPILKEIPAFLYEEPSKDCI